MGIKRRGNDYGWDMGKKVSENEDLFEVRKEVYSSQVRIPIV